MAMMTVFAATGDTWGISGPTFLKTFLILAVAGVLLSIIWRRAATSGGDLGNLRQPSPAELAYLNGGADLALHTSVAGLRCAGAIGPGPTPGTLVAAGPMPAGFSDLDYVVHSALRTPQVLPTVQQRPEVSAALRRVADRLEEDGLLLSAGQRAATRGPVLVMGGLVALGIARIFAGAANHKPIGYLVLVSVTLLFVGLLFLRVPKVSRSGRKLLARQRSSYAYLRPNLSPSWATYGAGGAMLGVALYGSTALWIADPAFAQHAGIARAALSSGSTGSSWTSSSSSCSSGDSGSSSSSCSGGSSCGGGGCGGGGCGG
jgi:uncharacterized protein (TIGR04222 family)